MFAQLYVGERFFFNFLYMAAAQDDRIRARNGKLVYPGDLGKRTWEQCKSGSSKCRVCQEEGLPDGIATIPHYDHFTHKKSMRLTISRYRWTTGTFANRQLVLQAWHYHPCLYAYLFAFTFI